MPEYSIEVDWCIKYNCEECEAFLECYAYQVKDACNCHWCKYHSKKIISVKMPSIVEYKQWGGEK